MSAVTVRSRGAARAHGMCGRGLLRRRLLSRSDVKRAPRACRSQNRQLMRGGRA
jgi:hypothetical protein